MTQEWFYLKDGKQHGPVSTEELRALGVSGQVDRSTMVWRAGMQTWQPAAAVDGLFQESDPPPGSMSPQAETARSGLRDRKAPKPSQVGRWAVLLYLASMMLTIVGLPVLLAIGGMIDYGSMRIVQALLVLASVGAVLLFLTAIVMALMWIRLAWSDLPPARQPTRPAMAIGLLFVPLFNFYWVFRVLPHISASQEDLLVEAGVPGERNSRSYLAAVIACVAWTLPFVNPYLVHGFFFWWLYLADRQRKNLLIIRSKASREIPVR